MIIFILFTKTRTICGKPWLDILILPFNCFHVYGPRLRQVRKHAKKKKRTNIKLPLPNKLGQ